MVSIVFGRSHLVGMVFTLAFALVGAGSAVAAPSVEGDSAPKNAEAAAEKPDAEEGAAGEKGSAGEEGAVEGPTPDLAAEKKAAEEACKKAVDGLRSKSLSDLEGMTEAGRGGLLAGPTGVGAVTCLAIAHGDKNHCNLLEGDAKRACVDQWATVAELQGVAKEQIKGQLLFLTCSSNAGGPHCEVMRQAVNEGSAEKCQEIENASNRALCSAVASRDASKCDGVTAGVERAYCAAFASDDPSRCPPDATDCIAMARGFAALKSGGLEAFQDIDASLAAAVLGSKACDHLLDKLVGTCATSGDAD